MEVWKGGFFFCSFFSSSKVKTQRMNRFIIFFLPLPSVCALLRRTRNRARLAPIFILARSTRRADSSPSLRTEAKQKPNSRKRTAKIRKRKAKRQIETLSLSLALDRRKKKMTPPPLPPPQPAVLPPSRVLVAGSTGWLGQAVVAELLGRGYHVTALARDPDSTAAQELRSLGASVAGGDVTCPPSLQRAMEGEKDVAATETIGSVSAIISCVGLRDLAVPDSEISRVLRQGTLNLADAAEAAGASVLVAVAGGIHRLRNGEVNREMVHNRMREEALEEIARRRSEKEKESAEAVRRTSTGGEETSTSSLSAPPLPPALVAIDPSVFFKDAETIFDMIARSVKKKKGKDGKKEKGKLTLVEGSWAVSSNPISARGLASRLADALKDQRQSPSSSTSSSSSSLVRRFRVGGPQVVTFAELAEEAGRALGVGVEKGSIPRPVARALLGAASLFSLFGIKKALAAKRFLSFLWVVGTDESPGSLVGEERCGGESLSGFFEELGRRKKEKRSEEGEK